MREACALFLIFASASSSFLANLTYQSLDKFPPDFTKSPIYYVMSRGNRRDPIFEDDIKGSKGSGLSGTNLRGF